MKKEKKINNLDIRIVQSIYRITGRRINDLKEEIEFLRSLIKKKKINNVDEDGLYCAKNKTNGKYLNYASSKKRFFSNKFNYYVVESPFPTLRPKEHIENCLFKWIINTPEPFNYALICMVEAK